MKLSDNALLTCHAASGMVQHGFVDHSATLAMVDRATTTFDVRKSKRDPEAANLSGGDSQKFIVGREILRDPGVLVVSQPTWGVDAGAAATIRQALIDLAGRGTAVLVVSQDLDELIEIADRIAVMFDGRLSAPIRTAEVTREELGLLMGGAKTAGSPASRTPAMRLVLERRSERSATLRSRRRSSRSVFWSRWRCCFYSSQHARRARRLFYRAAARIAIRWARSPSRRRRW